MMLSRLNHCGRQEESALQYSLMHVVILAVTRVVIRIVNRVTSPSYAKLDSWLRCWDGRLVAAWLKCVTAVGRLTNR